MKYKKTYIVLLLFISLVLLTSCGQKEETIDNIVSNDTNSNLPSYILTNPTGVISLFDLKGDLIEELDIGNKNSDYIYTMDNGNVYAEELNKEKSINNIMYAVDKNKGNLTIIKISTDGFEKIASKNLRDSKDIDSIYAYMGSFFYSVKSKNIRANKHTFSKPEKQKENGIIDYNVSLPVAKGKALKTYIVIEDFTDEYKEGMNFDKIFKKEQLAELGLHSFKRKILEIPYEVDSWTASNDNIYFFFEEYMGQYRIAKDQISLYYGPKDVVSSYYLDGKNKSVVAMSKLGEDSTKSVILEMEHKDMQITKSIEIEESELLGFDIVKNKQIYSIFKNPMEKSESFAKLKVLDYKTYDEVQSVPLKYIPTKVLSKNGYIYLFNPHEDYFLLGSLGSSSFSKYRKNFDIEEDTLAFDDIFVLDFVYEEEYSYDKQGRLVNDEGKLINRDNELIDENKKSVNKYGQIINEFGRAINEEGQFIDRFNNVIDREGNILEYIENEDGFYRNKFGDIVSEQGQILVQDDNGDWALPKAEERPPIEGYYDETGKFVISPAYLEKYPDAYDYIPE